MTSAPVPSGTPVTYHGSIQAAHGPATVVASVPDHGGSADGYRYVLKLSVAVEGFTDARNVRRQSFTVPEADSEAKRRERIRAQMDAMPTPTPAQMPELVGLVRVAMPHRNDN